KARHTANLKTKARRRSVGTGFLDRRRAVGDVAIIHEISRDAGNRDPGRSQQNPALSSTMEAMPPRLSTLTLCLISLATRPLSADAPIDFVRDIQPIFKQSCVECHDAKKHKADLRLDNRADALKGGEGGPALLPGNSKESLLMKRVRGEGDDDRMPVKKPPLT